MVDWGKKPNIKCDVVVNTTSIGLGKEDKIEIDFSDYKGKKVPEILLSGDHKKVNEWKLANSLWVTREKRPDLFEQLQLSEKEMILLRHYGDYLTKKHE